MLLADSEALVGLIDDRAIQDAPIWHRDPRAFVAVHRGVEPADLGPAKNSMAGDSWLRKKGTSSSFKLFRDQEPRMA